FIRSVRLKRAAQLLKDSNYNVSEISDLVGFNSIKYFNKYFKEEFGITPTQYRTENVH
ncbi:MAG: helix-turn-helix transcriptional regulator, partial [Paludibacteraceae bacterium]